MALIPGGTTHGGSHLALLLLKAKPSRHPGGGVRRQRQQAVHGLVEGANNLLNTALI
jgi:hypothetical protein